LSFPARALGLAGLALLSGLASAQSANSVLERAFGCRFPLDVRMVMRRQSADAPTTLFHVHIARGEGVSTVIVQPTVFEGRRSFDDGKQLTSFDPENGRFVQQVSAYQTLPSAAWRTRLAMANYQVRIEGKTEMFGRDAVILRATPRERRMQTRILILDESTGLPFHYDLIDPEGDRQRVLEVLRFDILSTPPEIKLEPNEERGPVVRPWGPQAVEGREAAGRAVGVPLEKEGSYPGRFMVYAHHLVGERSNPRLAMRMTDGFSLVTLYVWNVKRAGETFFGRRAMARSEDTAAIAIGDAPISMLERIASEALPAGSGTVSGRRNSNSRTRVVVTQETKAEASETPIPNPKILQDKKGHEIPSKPIRPPGTPAGRGSGLGRNRDLSGLQHP
jgi:hypothetical protein